MRLHGTHKVTEYDFKVELIEWNQIKIKSFQSGNEF